MDEHAGLPAPKCHEPISLKSVPASLLYSSASSTRPSASRSRIRFSAKAARPTQPRRGLALFRLPGDSRAEPEITQV